jgi:hypothetical protein
MARLVRANYSRALPRAESDLRPLSLRGAFATRQSATAHALDRIAASQTLLAMTNQGGPHFDVHNENCCCNNGAIARWRASSQVVPKV